MSKTTRRGLFGAAALLTAVPAVAHAGSPHPDGELIAACYEWLRINREFDRYYVTLDGDIEDNDPGWAILDPARALEERIVASRATTAEGFLARARCLAFSYMPHNPACSDDPDDATQTRFKAALLRDLTALEWGAVA